MRYADAFAKLGYLLEAPRQDWSASNDSGVCLSLWRSEIDWKSLSFDTRVNAGPVETWNVAGRNKRRRHLAQAIAHHGGWIDVVVVDGVPGEGVDNASPWMVKERQGRRWKVVDLDPEIGHFKTVAMVS